MQRSFFHATVACQAHHVDMGNTSVLEQSSQIEIGPTRFIPKHVSKSRVVLKPTIQPLLHDDVELRSVDLWDDICPLGPADAMDRPQSCVFCFGRVGGIDHCYAVFKGFVVGGLVRGVEGDVVEGMAIFGSYLQDEGQVEKLVDERGQFTAAWDCKRAMLDSSSASESKYECAEV